MHFAFHLHRQQSTAIGLRRRLPILSQREPLFDQSRQPRNASREMRFLKAFRKAPFCRLKHSAVFTSKRALKVIETPTVKIHPERQCQALNFSRSASKYPPMSCTTAQCAAVVAS